MKMTTMQDYLRKYLENKKNYIQFVLDLVPKSLQQLLKIGKMTSMRDNLYEMKIDGKQKNSFSRITVLLLQCIYI